MNRFYSILYSLVLLSAIVLGLLGWRDSRQATVLVEWTTASELDTAGFNLHRSENSDGPFTQINTALIPASSDPLTGNNYSYEDRPVQPGKLYYYQLEEVEFDGGSSYYGPISVQAQGASNLGLYLSLAVLVMGVVFGVFYLANRIRQPRAGRDESALEGEL